MIENLSLVELTQKAEQAFTKINGDTSDTKESNAQKQAQLATFLDEYKEIVDKWANIEMNVQLMINYKEEIVQKTSSVSSKEFVEELFTNWIKINSSPSVENLELIEDRFYFA